MVSSEGPGEGLVLCNNLERALYLSLKYQFVTPLTSLVVVKPDRRYNDKWSVNACRVVLWLSVT